MKAYIILTLALLVVSTYAGYGLDIKKLLATKKGGMLSRDQLKYVSSSQYNEYIITTTFFTQGDLTKDGKLSLAEFGKAYGAFIFFTTGETIKEGLVLARYQLATFEQGGKDYVDLAGFTFIVTLDLKFIYNNYDLFDGNLHTLSATINKVRGALQGIETNTLIGAAFFGFDYDKDSYVTPAEFRSGFRILGYILGVNLSYTSGILNDFFAAADASSDGKIGHSEAIGFINSHLTTIETLLHVIGNRRR